MVLKNISFDGIAMKINELRNNWVNIQHESSREAYPNALTFYISHYNRIPNTLTQKKIDLKKAHDWFIESYKSEIKNFYFNGYESAKKNIWYNNIIYFLADDLVIHFDTNHRPYIEILFRSTDITIVEKLIEGLRKYPEKERQTPSIKLLTHSTYGIDTVSLEISKPKFNIGENYNDDFVETHQTIKKRLSKKNDKGIVLLHGKPGTGKTSYIRYLISTLKKEVIFLPPNLAHIITNPDLMAFLISNPNSILVIEDAENIIMNRDHSSHSPVSNLLNITDGLLSDCLNIQIICTFNTDISKIDNALMRKGRLIGKYEFKELETEKAQRLSDKLGFKTTIHSPMILTDIYNQEERMYEQTMNRSIIGFSNRLVEQ
jgi:DNA replication protein DnaC